MTAIQMLQITHALVYLQVKMCQSTHDLLPWQLSS